MMLVHASKWIYVIVFLGVSCPMTAQKHKRQIYREQVLPALGGKIPEDAFRTDRLALNRLNKDGITVVDGVLLEARDHDKNPDNVRSKPEVIQVYVTPDNRYVPPEGRYHNERPKAVDTTYVIRKPVGHHQGEVEHQRLNGIGNIHNSNNNNNNDNNHNNNKNYNYNQNNNKNNNNNNNNHHFNNNNNNNGVHGNGYHKPLKIIPQGLRPPKSQGYVNFHTFAPENHPVQQAAHFYSPTIYKPIVTPLIIPPHEIIFKKPYPRPTHNFNGNTYPWWDFSFDWNPFYRSSQPLLFADANDFFDPHQIITDYAGFLDSFHGRSYRHIGSPKRGSDENLLNVPKVRIAGANTFTTDQRHSTNVPNEKSNGHVSLIEKSASYTDLTSIPETGFSCAGKKGTFADIETKCQVFHECSGWSKTSSLCPVGTAYSATKKRCEWWNTFTCGSE